MNALSRAILLPMQISLTPRWIKRQRHWALALVVLALCSASLACSSLEDVVGQPRGGPTPTVPLFATATPGGRISVFLTTPTGQANDTNQAGTPVTSGQVVGPAATATAAYATMVAATATAGATMIGPNFQPNDCPPVGGPPPALKPQTFSQYPEQIGVYLSAGGPSTILEATLRSWGAINDTAAVQADTDLTGDGIPEVIVTLYDPAFYKPNTLSPGTLLVYGCYQKGRRLLYSTPYSPTTMLPELKRVGDMNSDARAELAFTQQTCTGAPVLPGGPPTQCTQVMQILSWNAAIGGFSPLNDIPMNATNGKVNIADLDKDGILEVQITFQTPNDPAAGPPRRSADIWDWNGINYVLALSQSEPPVYRIHALNDGDVRFKAGDWTNAIKLYNRVRDDDKLLAWTVLNELPVLRAYATYKKMLAYIGARQPKSADDVLATLQSENPSGTPGEIFAILGQTFSDSYKQTKDRKKACVATLGAAQSRPDALSTLNGFGYANRTYTISDLCPFAAK